MIDLQDIEERLAIRLEGSDVPTRITTDDAGHVLWLRVAGQLRPWSSIRVLSDVDAAIDDYRATEAR